jgi:hypothetical protein
MVVIYWAHTFSSPMALAAPKTTADHLSIQQTSRPHDNNQQPLLVGLDVNPNLIHSLRLLFHDPHIHKKGFPQ